MKYYGLGCWICAMLLFVACGGEQKAPANNEANRIVKIKAELASVVTGVSDLHYSGTIEPLQTVDLSFETVGTVDKVLVQEGDAVRKGQLLATINKSDDEQLRSVSQAKYKQAKDAYSRFKSVYNSGSLSEMKWVEIETTLKEAESQLQLARSGIDKCRLRSPIDGIVGKRDVEPGQYSLSLKTPLKIVVLKTIQVKISVAENEIGKIRKGEKANFTIAAINGKLFVGTVASVGVMADPIARTYDVKIIISNPNLEIKPGMVCNVSLNAGIEQSFLSVPKNAVSRDDNGKAYVYVVSPSKKRAIKQIVQLGNYRDNSIEITGGLSTNQLVITEGKEKLSNNSLISL
jgi:RND family efflux transporter MFP subunit